MILQRVEEDDTNDDDEDDFDFDDDDDDDDDETLRYGAQQTLRNRHNYWPRTRWYSCPGAIRWESKAFDSIPYERRQQQ